MPVPQITDRADFQDELDVYMVLFNLGKERGVRLLSDEQLKMLVQAGRIDDDMLGLTPPQNQARMSEESAGLFADTIIVQIMDYIEQKIKRLLKEGEWEKMTEEEKVRLKEEMFFGVWGNYPGYFRLSLIHKLIK